jgi:hypothetical protein
MSISPSEPVTETIVVHGPARLSAVCRSYLRAKEFCQKIHAANHSPSANALDHRDVKSPSTALSGLKCVPCCEEAEA